MNPDERFGLWFAVLVIVLGATVAVWAIYWEYRKRQLQHDERRSMIEKGMTPPPLHPAGSWRQAYPQQLRHEARLRMIEKGIPVTLDDKKPWAIEDFLRRGTIMLFVGIGLGIAYFALSPTNDFKGLIGFLAPLLGSAGLGCIIYYYLAKDRLSEKPAENPER